MSLLVQMTNEWIFPLICLIIVLDSNTVLEYKVLAAVNLYVIYGGEFR